MKDYSKKRILQIGRGVSTFFNIDYYKKQGAYVIVADKCNPEVNRYKSLVDEVVEMNIDDIDEVVKYAKDNKVDAIVTNFEEKSYEKARIMNERIGNTFYHTKEQWNVFMNKDNFRDLCHEFNINTPKTFYSGKVEDLNDDIIKSFKYPLIIKPTDNCGGKGITVCKNKRQIVKALRYAKDHSYSSNIIIEEFVIGKEVIFSYIIQNGICRLVSSSDKYDYKNKYGLTAMPDAYIYPCLDHDLYLKEENDKVIKMINSRGLNNCAIYFQGIERDQKFYLFEAGLRAEGTCSYFVNAHFNNQNYCDFLLDFLAKVDTDYNVELDDPKLNGHESLLYSVHLKKGIIKKIDGLSYYSESKNIYLGTKLKSIGEKSSGTMIDSIVSGVYIDADSRKEFVEEIRNIRKHIKVRGIFNQNLVYNGFDEKILLENNK